METFLAFLGDNAAAILGLLTAALAAGGAGTLLLKRLLGDRDAAAQSRLSTIGKANGQGIVVIHGGNGNAVVHRNATVSATPELAEELNLPKEVTANAVFRLDKQSSGSAISKERLIDFARDWRAARDRVNGLCETRQIDRSELDRALKDADLQRVDRLCRELEADTGTSHSPADGA